MLANLFSNTHYITIFKALIRSPDNLLISCNTRAITSLNYSMQITVTKRTLLVSQCYQNVNQTFSDVISEYNKFRRKRFLEVRNAYLRKRILHSKSFKKKKEFFSRRYQGLWLVLHISLLAINTLKYTKFAFPASVLLQNLRESNLQLLVLNLQLKKSNLQFYC